MNKYMTLTNVPQYYIGLMSGTSADGIDLALVTFDNLNQPSLRSSYYQPYSKSISNKITSLYGAVNSSEKDNIDCAFELDVELAQLFAEAVNTLLKKERLSASDIAAIGNHGQTIRHRPQAQFPFTLQIGCSQTLAALTNIKVVGQFRQKDMAYGGQGAPLTPAFHQKIFTENDCDVFIVNIGGIANITYLPSEKNNTLLGFDTGPGNALIDDWFQLHHPKSHYKYDKNGTWSSTGQSNSDLLKQLLTDDYCQLVPPKSTGREYFNLIWLTNKLNKFKQHFRDELTPQDIQATLTDFTAMTISKAITSLTNHKAKIYLCGGGAHNAALKRRLNQHLNVATKTKKSSDNIEVIHTNQKGIDGDQLEAIAFAWFAFAYDKKLLSNIPAVTGASKYCTLGTEFLP
jgi:anhydro-N-acetylmuramic acid kinase